MLAAEADRRTPPLIAGIEDLASSEESDPERVEELRGEAHGLKGAALVVGEKRLGELGRGLEARLKELAPEGRIPAGEAPKLVAAAQALADGARAAAAGEGEPPTVAESLTAFGA